MKPTVTFLAMLLLAGGARAGDVYVTRDAQGNPVYTDTPQSIPAEKLGIASTSTDPAAVQKRYADQMKQYGATDKAATKASTQQANAQKASEMTAEDLAKRCTEARQRYQTYMESHRLYTEDPNGQRQYLSSEEIDAARATAKQAMDQFCGGK